jgi:hypothetical protein
MLSWGMVRLSARFDSVRALLAACLTVLLLATSFAPCCAFARTVEGTQVSAPSDPCKRSPAPLAASCVCTQLACQAFDKQPALTILAALGLSTRLNFVVSSTAFADRDERPDHPPPRPLL